MGTQIKAEIVAHSINEQGDELISVLATFPRIILAEVNTHRMLSKNTSSSRAIPFAKMVETIKNDPFIPIAWQKEHKGMQGTEYLEGGEEINAYENWLLARKSAISEAEDLHDAGVTKQLCNRLLEPFMWTTMLITGPKSGWDNFFNLRCPQYYFEPEDKAYKSRKEWIDAWNGTFETGKDVTRPAEVNDWDNLFWLKQNKGQAEIHMMALAECIWDAYNESTPRVLKAGQWHIPFNNKISETLYPSIGDVILDRVKISVAMAARTSYTVVGEEKALDYEAMIGLHDRLLSQDPPHSSPLEHCARAMSEIEYTGSKKTGYSTINKGQDEGKGYGWCNNFKGFIPYRYMVDNGNQEAKD